jgi:hypothetical protein
MGKRSEICPKRRISKISQGASEVPLRSHELVKLGKKREYISYKGLRYGDRLRKRVILSEIIANYGRESSRHDSIYGYK